MSKFCVDMCFHFSWVYIPRSGIARPCGDCMFNHWRNYQTIFWGSCTILHSHQRWMMVPLSLPPCHHLLLCPLDYGHPSEYEVLSHCETLRYFKLTWSFCCGLAYGLSWRKCSVRFSRMRILLGLGGVHGYLLGIKSYI